MIAHDLSTATFSAEDAYYFGEGTHTRLSDVLGAHLAIRDGRGGVQFGVWAPNARAVSVIGDFNEWRPAAHPLDSTGNSGVWAGFIDGLTAGARYKFHIESRINGYRVDKKDPVGLSCELAPGTASIVTDLAYEWHDLEWMSRRKYANALNAPISTYEVHLGSWRRAGDNRWLSYRELADQLVPYVKETGFTHVEFLPIMEHPFYGSWGYQITGFFAPTARYGSPADFMALIDRFHQEGIGVILDWVPSHFPNDEHGLGFFDGTHLYEHADPRQGVQPDWHTFVFNYGRNEVRSFLLSSAAFWLRQYHVDALRLDAVASMLYLDYSRKEGEWIPNRYGGRENLEAIDFLRHFNESMYREFPDTQTIAEESTAWPMVSRPVYIGGLGFGMKWDMGWMHDTLQYMSQDPFFRKYHHPEITFRMMYAFSENFVLPLSHDEVVYGKGSLIGKMPGDNWQKFANLRLLYSYMYAQPGKKLLFMGGEFAQWAEWNHDASLDWALLAFPQHSGIRLLLGDLNHLYRDRLTLHECESTQQSFEWIDAHDSEKNVLSFMRKSSAGGRIAVVCNFSPVVRTNYRLGVPSGGMWREIFNSDAPQYGGSGQGNFGGATAVPIPLHGRSHSITITLPPLAAVFFELTQT